MLRMARWDMAIAIAMVICATICSHGGESGSGLWMWPKGMGMGVLATLRDFTHDFKLMTAEQPSAQCTHTFKPTKRG